ncbi:MAG: bacteriophage N4 adsorption protein B [candidate division BRC1 bacterium ADurb.BinA364]|nr:MAG: bacteriophage N4 adsorption protein B [candidate division BRC1 bacterium ADurb.BinA364]
MAIDPEILGLLPREFCERNMVAPILVDEDALVVAMEDPTNVVAIDEIEEMVEADIRPVIASCRDILDVLRQRQAMETEAEERTAALAIARRRKRFRALRAATVFLIAVAPFVLFWLGYLFFYDVQRFVKQFSLFDKTLFGVLGLGLWAAFVYWLAGRMLGGGEDE